MSYLKYASATIGATTAEQTCPISMVASRDNDNSMLKTIKFARVSHLFRVTFVSTTVAAWGLYPFI